MNLDRAVLLLAGTMTLLSVLLVALVSPWWLLLTAFVGLNLLQSSITGLCPAPSSTAGSASAAGAPSDERRRLSPLGCCLRVARPRHGVAVRRDANPLRGAPAPTGRLGDRHRSRRVPAPRRAPDRRSRRHHRARHLPRSARSDARTARLRGRAGRLRRQRRPVLGTLAHLRRLARQSRTPLPHRAGTKRRTSTWPPAPFPTAACWSRPHSAPTDPRPARACRRPATPPRTSPPSSRVPSPLPMPKRGSIAPPAAPSSSSPGSALGARTALIDLRDSPGW